MVVHRFVERATDIEVEKLKQAVEDLAEVSTRTTDIREILTTKDKFYAVLIVGARSSALQQLVEGIQARVQVLRATSLSEVGRSLEVVQELRAIVTAIGERDAELASRLCADHVRKASLTALHSLREAEATI